MKKQFNQKLSFKKETVANLAGGQMGQLMGGNIATGDDIERTRDRSICICVYTDRCPTTNGWICQETCGYVSNCGTVCNSNPCCMQNDTINGR